MTSALFSRKLMDLTEEERQGYSRRALEELMAEDQQNGGSGGVGSCGGIANESNGISTEVVNKDSGGFIEEGACVGSSGEGDVCADRSYKHYQDDNQRSVSDNYDDEDRDDHDYLGCKDELEVNDEDDEDKKEKSAEPSA